MAETLWSRATVYRLPSLSPSIVPARPAHVEAALALFGGHVGLLDVVYRSARRAAVEEVDKLLDGIGLALGLALDLRRSAPGFSNHPLTLTYRPVARIAHKARDAHARGLLLRRCAEKDALHRAVDAEGDLCVSADGTAPPNGLTHPLVGCHAHAHERSRSRDTRTRAAAVFPCRRQLCGLHVMGRSSLQGRETASASRVGQRSTATTANALSCSNRYRESHNTSAPSAPALLVPGSSSCPPLLREHMSPGSRPPLPDSAVT